MLGLTKVDLFLAAFFFGILIFNVQTMVKTAVYIWVFPAVGLPRQLCAACWTSFPGWLFSFCLCSCSLRRRWQRWQPCFMWIGQRASMGQWAAIFAGFFPVPSMLSQTTIQKPSIFEGLIISTHMKSVEIGQYLYHESCLLEHVLEPPKH